MIVCDFERAERFARDFERAMNDIASAFAVGVSGIAALAPKLERLAREQGRIQVVTMDDGVTRWVVR